MTPAEMTSIDDIGLWLEDHGREEGLAHLAGLVLRRVKADAEALLHHAVARLSGVLRIDQEQARISAMLADATPPPDLAAAPVAPARGPLRLLDNVIRTRGGLLYRDGTRRGQRLDRLTMMCREAWLSHERKGGRAEDFRAPFTPGQIAMGCHYQALIERHHAAGIKCASVEVRAVASPGGGGGDFIEAYIAESQQLDRIINRIGSGVALSVIRGAPGRRDITTRALVDAVCRDGDDLTAVLKDHGWAAKGDSRDALRKALAAALDRMQGYR